MSDLLNSASLVMIPSGYKEDVVYSQIPTNGNGDLSFTRASNGTRVNSAGLVEDCPWNLFEYSEDFSNAFWTKVRSTITTNTTAAPNGTTTADTFTCTETGINGCFLYNSPSLSIERTTSVYVKANTCFYFQIHRDYGSGVVFDLTNGTIKQSSGATGTITSVGNGWYRCTATFSATGASLFLLGNENMTVSSWYTTINQNLYIWGAQLNIGSTAKPYFPTTDRLNVPRLTYQNGGGGCPSLLLEKQSTNLSTYSNDISNASYNYQNSSVSGVTTTSPDGTSNAYGIVADTSTNNFHRWYKTFGALSGTYTTAIYAKKGTSKYFAIGWNTDGSTGNNNVVVYDLDAGTIASNPYSITASIESVGNGWYRCIQTFNFGTGASFADLCVANAGLLSNYVATSFQVYDSPSVSTTLYVWGVQVEQSSYATSYIPTTSSSATRVADECVKTGISSLIGQTEGVAFIDFDFNGNYSSGGIIPISLSGTSGNEMYIWIQTNGQIRCDIFASSAGQVAITGNIGAIGRKKMAVAYKQNDFAFYMNGSLIGIDTSGNVPSLSSVHVGKYYANNTYDLNAGINQAILFPTRLTNAELASLTTL